MNRELKRLAISQSNYIPWKGYFNIIKCVDEFILLDDVQYTRRDWRNRNLIKSKHGLKWLTVPVDVKGNYSIKIKDVNSKDNIWRQDHWNQISESYKHAPYFKMLSSDFKELYLGSSERNLSKINYGFICLVNSILKIETPIRWSMEFAGPSEKSERLVHICQKVKADQYISGSAAADYIRNDLFSAAGIKVIWVDYTNFPIYHQLFPPFEHGVSIVDLLFNEGPNAAQFLKDEIWI